MKTLFAAAILAAGISTSADAAIILGNSYTFTASGFASGPASSVSGSFSLLFNSGPSTYTLTALSLTIAGASYSPSNSGLYNYEDQSVAIGANVNGVQGVSEGSNDFVLFFNPASLQSSKTFYYTSATAGNSGTYFAGTVNVDAVPEPASWAMLVIGFGVAGAALRRRRTVAFA